MEEIQTLPVATTPDQLIALAVDKNLDIEKLEKLLALKERWEAGEARKRFEEALSQFQEKCPDIRKTKPVRFETRGGGTTEYYYAPLGDIERQIRQLLKDCGLTKKWKPFVNKEEIKVICIISHIAGHSEETEMSASPDATGSKNPIQAIASTVEYLKRHTLLAALGITTADQDVDGRLPELDVDKLHKQYMELYEKIVLKDDKFRTPGHPDNWAAERTPHLYVQAIGKARQIIAKLTL